jgi:hypothetical protein
MRNTIRFSIVLAVLLCVSSAFAQNTNSGDIRGTALDSTGAVIPGVTVTVKDVDKDIITTYTTDGAGLFDTGSIVTDHYLITFEKDGFKEYIRGPVTLEVQTLTIDGHLQVGATTETVQVTTDVQLLQTETGSQSTTMAEQELKDLPNQGTPSWENFVVLTPGAAASPTGGGSAADPGQQASVNGNAVFYNVLGDGTTMSLPSNGNSYDYNFDSLQEVQMITSAGSAQYENGGVLYNQISKGGTSHFHGDLFEYFQNTALNAASYGFGQLQTVPITRGNYFGGSFGGPVPFGTFKKKLFFFFNYNYSQNESPSNGFETVPTQAWMNGDFTGAPPVYDPTTQVVDANGNLHRQSFACEYYACDYVNGNKIPSGLMSPVAQAIQKYYPTPNVPNPTVNQGITTNNVFYNYSVSNPGWSYFYRVDYDITPKNRLTATEFYTYGQGNELTNDCPINCTDAHNTAITAQISDVWTFSSAMVNEFHAGFSTQNNWYIPATLDKGYPAKLGIDWNKADMFPEVNINGTGIWGLSGGTNAIQHQIIGEPTDVMTIIKGKHILHFGGEFLDYQVNASAAWGSIDAGAVNFSGAYTESTQGDQTSGLAYADFLLGQANSWSATNVPMEYERYKSLQAFVQDDIKIRPNLTLNAGMRWEGWTPNHEKYGNSRLFDPTIVNPAPNPFGVVNTLGAMWYGTTHTNGRMDDIASIWNIFLPRFGVAWQARPSTVIRGAIGLYAYNDQIGSQGTGGVFGSSGNEGDNTNGVLPVLLLDQDGSVNDQGQNGAPINSRYLTAPTAPDALNGQSVHYNLFHTPPMEIWQYNLNIQRTLGPNLAANVAYVGSHGYHQERWMDLNQIPESALGQNDTQGLTNARQYPNYQSVSGQQWDAISNYNALQATIEKRMSSGLQFNFNYTWSKFLDEADNCAWNCVYNTGQNGWNLQSNYGPAAFDIRSMFKGRAVYKLPFGRGAQFLNNSNLLDEIIGGWQTSGTVIWQSGNPFTPETSDAWHTYAQAGSQFANVVPGASLYGTGYHQLSQWFNVNAFTDPGPAAYGNAGRNSIRGPGLSDINFSLGKSFTVWRESKLEIRCDANNVLNHPSFGQPDAFIGPGHEAAITSLTVGGRSAEIIAKFTF